MVKDIFQQSDYIPKLSKTEGKINLLLPKRITDTPIPEKHIIYSFSQNQLSIIENNQVNYITCDKYIAKCIIFYDIVLKCTRQKIQNYISIYKDNLLSDNQDILKFLTIEGDVKASALLKIARCISEKPLEELQLQAKEEQVSKGFSVLLKYLVGD